MPRLDRVNIDAQLLLERAYGLGEGGLRDEHAPRRLADRSVGCNRIRISHLLKRHNADIIRFTSAACLPPHDGLKRRAAASDRVECVGDRADDVVYVLDSDREPDELRTRPALEEVLLGELRVCR